MGKRPSRKKRRPARQPAQSGVRDVEWPDAAGLFHHPADPPELM
jgi:hypothetical protein